MNQFGDERRPVIIGVGEISDRPSNELAGLEPRVLMSQAVRLAQADAGVSLLGEVDRLDVVMQVSWSYENLPQLLAEDLQLGAHVHKAIGPIGGETPVAMLADAAAAIARGECRMAVICGAEAARTRASAAAVKHSLNWTPRPEQAAKVKAGDYVTALAARYGLVQPIHVYPLYENAARVAWSQSLDQAQAETGRVWAAMSDVAQENPYAWTRRALSAQEITTPSDRNRLICHPYLKLMVAQPTVNQGAAIIVTSLAHARALGVAEDRLVHVWSGAGARELDDFLARDRFDRSLAMQTALQQTLAVNGLAAADLDLFELYSCFPVVPKMARRFLGLEESTALTVTGGLTFFGAPLNDYMAHATAAMVRALRAGKGRAGLLYGNGGYVTKHQALVLGVEPAKQCVVNLDAQAQAKAGMASSPTLLEQHTGVAIVETYTAQCGRDGSMERGIVVARTSEGARVVAHVPADDRATLAFLVDGRHEPVGHRGATACGDDGLLRWQP